MKIKQIEYALCVAKNLSFSKAAVELYVSQPNVSSTVQALEEELGYQIFIRNNQGISITSKGLEFLAYSKNILNDIANIMSIGEKDPLYKLNIYSQFDHTLVDEAFYFICKEYEKEKFNFSLSSGTIEDVIDSVFIGNCHLGIVFMSDNTLENFSYSFLNKGLKATSIAKLNIQINLRKDHPLLKEEPFAFEKLKDYPYVNYIFNKASDVPEILALGIINSDRMINISNKDLRVKIVSTTDCFSIGCALHPNMYNIGSLKSVILPGVQINLVILEKKGSDFFEERRRFGELLKAELKKL